MLLDWNKHGRGIYTAGKQQALQASNERVEPAR